MIHTKSLIEIHLFLQAAETECLVTDFDKDGEPSGFSTQCVTEGTACPCGKNTVAWKPEKRGELTKKRWRVNPRELAIELFMTKPQFATWHDLCQQTNIGDSTDPQGFFTNLVVVKPGKNGTMVIWW